MPSIIINFLAVALGGAIGSCLRYGVSLCYSGTHSIFALHTITVNIIGSFIIGLLFAYVTTFNVSPVMRIFLFVGLLGGFTTFSSFSLETINMLRNGFYGAATIYIMVSNLLGILAAFGGLLLGGKIVKL
ncbi:MAG: fluoride efflux transporter CrcB [Muribaculaceae bacterium]